MLKFVLFFLELMEVSLKKNTGLSRQKSRRSTSQRRLEARATAFFVVFVKSKKFVLV